MKNYWWLCANPKEWSFNSLAEGEVKAFSNRTSKGKMRAHFAAAQVGELVVGYEAWPQMKVVALLQISAKDEHSLSFKKLDEPRRLASYHELKQCPQLANMSFFKWNSGTLFPLKQAEYEFIVSRINEDDSPGVYCRQRFLDEVYMEEERYETLTAVLAYKKNLILQGAPGVGKTYAAKRLAYAMMGEMDDSLIEFVQFHQNYTYEDFVMGYRPDGDCFTLKEGIFYRFCRKAADQPNKPFFFIIDEINRGNMSKIFGELLMLIEKDYRGRSMKLAYDDVSFSVPENLHIIGMMNTADRSLAMIDYALRRRFSFVDMKPAFEVERFKTYQQALRSPVFDKLITAVCQLNVAIAEDRTLGEGFCIGHSYFCGLENEADIPARLRAVVEYDLLPMLREYWFDDKAAVAKWETALRAALS